MPILGPVSLVRGQNSYPEHVGIESRTLQKLYQRARAKWPGTKHGGLIPDAGEFGLAPIRASQMMGSTSNRTFSQRFGSTGWKNIFNRATMDEDFMFGIYGLAFAEPPLLFSQIQFIVGRQTYPVISIEELLINSNDGAYAGVILFGRGEELVIEEQTKFTLAGYVTAGGNQTVIPLGWQAYRQKGLSQMITQ